MTIQEKLQIWYCVNTKSPTQCRWRTDLKHRITNAVAEGLKSEIQQVKSLARGSRKFENYRIAILFFCAKLDMYPQKSR